MKKSVRPGLALIFIGILIVLIAAVIRGRPHAPAVNPDPNHTHADFAVYMGPGQKVNFARPEFMSYSADPAKGITQDHHLDEYIHLHDGNGHVIHMHKPGITLAHFFTSLGMTFEAHCFRLDADHQSCGGRMFVNGKEIPMNPDYVFKDLDKILITYGADDAEVQKELQAMTDDACLYSKTCPERGAPPTENCVSDVAIPCKA